MRHISIHIARHCARAPFHLAILALAMGCGSQPAPKAKQVEPASEKAAPGDDNAPTRKDAPNDTDATVTKPKGTAKPTASAKNKPLNDDQLAKLVIVAGKLACARKTLEDASALEKAETTILAQAGLKRSVLVEQMKLVTNNAMFQASVQQAVSLCTKAANKKAVELRGKLKALAVASQCLAKQGKSGDTMNQVMMAQYKAYGLTMSEYAREMAKLTNDRAFQAEIRQAVAACPEVDQAPADASTHTDARTEETADVGPMQDSAKNSEVTAASEKDTRKGDPNTASGQPSGADGAGGVPNIAPPTYPTPQVERSTSKPAAKVNRSLSFVWFGTFGGGSQRGRLTIRVKGGKVNATAMLGASRLSMSGRISGKQVRFSGRRAQTFGKFTGTVSGTKMSGRMTATMRLGGRLKSIRGRWSAKRK